MENKQYEHEELTEEQDEELNEEQEGVDDWSYEEVKYPAVSTISGFFNLLAYIFLGAGVLAFVMTLANTMHNDTAEALIVGAIALVVGGFCYLCCKAISELLIMFTDISISAREILIHMTEKDARTDLLSDSDTSEVDSQ